MPNNHLHLPSHVALLHDAFYMPQLGRHRRIWVCLPPNYHLSDKRYPVVYMHDGQNLFDNPSAIFGSWDVDRAINRLYVQSTDPDHVSAILIGIENGREQRLAEYAPWAHPEHGGGEGEKYLDFIVRNLKPYVDEHLRTLTDRENTGILGSSMGGLISLYAALRNSEVFGLAGVFSPSLWFSEKIFDLARQAPSLPVRILLMAGQQESDRMVSDLLELYEILLEAGHDEHFLHYDLHGDGVHSEWFWAREFEHALEWLFGGMPGHHRGVTNQWIHFRVDEVSKELVVKHHEQLMRPVLEVRDYCHYRQFHYPLQNTENRISYAAWENCIYSIRLLADGDLVFSRRVEIDILEAAEPDNHALLVSPTIT